MTHDQPTPPWAERAEMAVLSAAMQDPRSMAEARELSDEDFFAPRHQAIWRACCAIYDRGEPIDPVVLADQLDASGESRQAGGEEYIVEVLFAVPSDADVDHHVRTIRKRATLRRLTTTLRGCLTNVQRDPEQDPDAVVTDVLGSLMACTDQRSLSAWRRVGDLVLPTMEHLRAEAEGDLPPGIPSSIPSVTRMTGGWREGDLVILAARPSMGKTALAIQEAVRAARSGSTVYFASLEMSERSLTRRMIAQDSGVELARIRQMWADHRVQGRLAESAGRIKALPIWIDDRPGGTVEALRASLHRMAHKEKPGLVVVDYLQLMAAKGESRNQEVSKISRGLKAIAREFRVPVMALSQLSRGVENRQPPRPQLSDLRDSGAIEQDADVVLMLWRPEYYIDRERQTEEAAGVEGQAELIVAKQREGPTGAIWMHWDRRSTKFTQREETQDKEAVPWAS
ncbi:MAG: replicative DNA helicase [Gemmatimonadales bacterium]|nr:MAG: replicative DNA helicase [Gemmatimonadales bacterium]